MIHIIIDTSIYRKSPRLDSPEFKSLSYMAKKKCIQVHVPYVVEREFLTFLEQVQRTRIDKATNALASAINFENRGQKTTDLAELLEKLRDDTEELVNERSKSFLDWIERNHAERHPLTLELTNKALEAYFNGHPPLKEPKIRKHIPDSFIYQTILELQEKYGNNLYSVVKDKALNEACSNKKITTFDSLASFLESDEAQECLKQKLVDDNKAKVLKHVHDLANSETSTIIEGVEELLLSDDYRTISGNNVPGENGEIYVSSVDTPSSIEIGDIEYFGAGLFVVHFVSYAELIYEYPVYHTDAYLLDSKKYYMQPLNDHYVEVETTDEFQFIGRVELDFGEGVLSTKTVEDLISALQNPTLTISELEDFQIHNVEI